MLQMGWEWVFSHTALGLSLQREGNLISTFPQLAKHRVRLAKRFYQGGAMLQAPGKHFWLQTEPERNLSPHSENMAFRKRFVMIRESELKFSEQP